MPAADHPDRAAELLAKMCEPHVQALADSWPDPTPETLAFLARIFAPAVQQVIEHRATAEDNAA